MKRLLFAAMTAPAYPCFLQVMPLTLEPEAAIEKLLSLNKLVC